MLLRARELQLAGQRENHRGRPSSRSRRPVRPPQRPGRVHIDAGQPVISVDTKKKELVGNFKNGGREWQPKGQPEKVDVHDFPSDALGKAIPYGVYDIAADDGFVSVGVDHDTPVFAVASIEAWWREVGAARYPETREVFITADAGGSNSVRARAWKYSLQQLADKLGLSFRVSHFPPGTSKWNKIEHRLFSFISINWRGRPLRTHETIVNLIGDDHSGRAGGPCTT